MELEQFEFKRERKLGEFVQDFIGLLKIIIVHLGHVLFRLLALPICGMLLTGYYLSTQINLNVDYSSGELVDVIASFIITFGAMLVIGMFAFGFSIEYFILLRDRRDLSFNYADVWRSFKQNIGKYFKFLFAAFIVSIIVLIPVCFILFFCLFIPFAGTIAAGVVFAVLGLWFFSAFMLYREGYYKLTETFTSAFSMIKGRLMDYGIASYIVTFIFRALMTLIGIVPAAALGLLAYNMVGFSDDFFETYFGKIIVTFGSSLVTIFFIVYFMLSVISYGIIYEAAKELRFGEDVFEKIKRIGRGRA